ncbi:MAG: molybdenum cofactor guanylyltransferase [Deltaproteobacteria bacterium]|jgi:molybdopterin-guanine dinucleotide biosynthesis protein A|nr:molybdenum cofactor guanylyltransferase [Deltaproteobacteria bacterium]
MEKLADIAGVILAGGRSSRFGSNKALTLIDGKPLIRHVADLMAGLFQECLLVTNTPEEYEFLSLPMTHDRYQDCGPLAGIHAALLEINKERAFVVACDMPNLSRELIRYICSINEQEYDVIIPWLEKGQEPLFGIYHKNSLPVIESFLQQKDFQIIKAFEGLKVRRVSEKEVRSITGSLNCFKNINRPTDL